VASVRGALLIATAVLLCLARPVRAEALKSAPAPSRAVVSKPGLTPSRAAVPKPTPTPARAAASAPAPAPAPTPTPTVKLTAGFSPEWLGAGTTVHLGFRIAEPGGGIPPPLTELGLLYPAELGIATSSLGLEECSLEILQEDGVGGCPTNSLMGHGSAQIDVPFLLGPVLEPVGVTLLSGPVQEGHLGLLFFADGESPVIAKLPFAAFVLPAQGRFGGLLNAQIPLVAAVPEGPDAAIVRMQTTIGPSRLTYYRRVRGRLVGFRPRGILLPSRCPRGGFPFAAHLTFQSGAHVEASTVVPCPRSSVSRRRRQSE
jgi:hypothetical protein